MDKNKGLTIEVTVKEKGYVKIEQRVFYPEYKQSLYNLVAWLRDKYGMSDECLKQPKQTDSFLDY